MSRPTLREPPAPLGATSMNRSGTPTRRTFRVSRPDVVRRLQHLAEPKPPVERALLDRDHESARFSIARLITVGIERAEGTGR